MENMDSINDAFKQFLQLGELDHDIVTTYAKDLTRGSHQFAKVFSDYLLRFPATVRVLKKLEERGASLDSLVRFHTRHLIELVSGDTSDDNAEKLMRIGRIHSQNGIDPTWIVGCYLLYLHHLQMTIRTHELIPNARKQALDSSVTKLLFRDMGLLVRGCWVASPFEEHLDKCETRELFD